MHAPLRYGILGGTFDPPHIGHLALAQEAYARLGLDRVWFLPAGAPPHKVGRPISAGADRRAMVELAIAGDARFALCTVELERPGPSYTVETLQTLRAQWGADVWIGCVVGWDMLTLLPEWYDAPGVLAALDGLIAAHRPGFEADDVELAQLEARLPGLRERLTLLPSPQLDLAATSLRERVAAGLPIRYLAPDAVCSYIQEHGLYRDGR
ncbi:MAG: nicotinate-nucleotide adenylyltransferase [Ktedonobacterales bacterium]